MERCPIHAERCPPLHGMVSTATELCPDCLVITTRERTCTLASVPPDLIGGTAFARLLVPTKLTVGTRSGYYSQSVNMRMITPRLSALIRIAGILLPLPFLVFGCGTLPDAFHVSAFMRGYQKRLLLTHMIHLRGKESMRKRMAELGK